MQYCVSGSHRLIEHPMRDGIVHRSVRYSRERNSNALPATARLKCQNGPLQTFLFDCVCVYRVCVCVCVGLLRRLGDRALTHLPAHATLLRSFERAS